MANHILPETKITLVKRSPDPNIALSQNWIKANRERYYGRWVVLRGDQLLADASSSEELLQKIDPKDGKGKLITVIY
jgi:hypothetical protein